MGKWASWDGCAGWRALRARRSVVDVLGCDTIVAYGRRLHDRQHSRAAWQTLLQLNSSSHCVLHGLLNGLCSDCTWGSSWAIAVRSSSFARRSRQCMEDRDERHRWRLESVGIGTSTEEIWTGRILSGVGSDERENLIELFGSAPQILLYVLYAYKTDGFVPATFFPPPIKRVYFLYSFSL